MSCFFNRGGQGGGHRIGGTERKGGGSGGENDGWNL